MSPHAVNNFVSDLVLMAQAMERLPQVEADLEFANKARTNLEQMILAREADVQQAKDYAATLEAKVHELEVAKDAAETMFLEADERTSRALDFIKASFGSAGALIQSLEPPRPEPVIDNVHVIVNESSNADVHAKNMALHPEPTHSEGNEVAMHAEPIPQVSEVKPIDPNEGHAILSDGTTRYGVDNPSQGQSAADPIHGASQELQEHPADTISAEPSATPSPSWASPTPPDTKPQPYAGKNYYAFANYITHKQWIAGGGSDWDYWNRR